MSVAGTIEAVIIGALLVSVVVSLGLGFVVYLFLSKLTPMQRSIVLAFLILAGFVLIITLVGAEVGTITIFTGAFAEVFNLLRPQSSDPEA